VPAAGLTLLADFS